MYYVYLVVSLLIYMSRLFFVSGVIILILLCIDVIMENFSWMFG